MRGAVPPAGSSREDWLTGDFSALAGGSLIVGELLCEEVRLCAKERVLDVATGSGNAALSAARRRASVTAVDFVPALIARARERALAERLRLSLGVAVAENLPFRDESFDVVLSTFGVMFSRDPARAASEMLRTCRHGGRIGLTAWVPEGAFGRLLEVTDALRPGPAGVPTTMRWGTRDGLESWFGGSAEPLRLSVRELWVRADSAESFVEGYLRFFGPFRRVHESLADANRSSYRSALLAVLQDANRAHDGTLLAPLAYLEATFRRR